MPLTTNTTVWKILLGIVFILTLFFGILFYFIDISILFVFSALLILITTKLSEYYNHICKKIYVKGLIKKIIGWCLIIIVLLSLSLITKSQINDITESLDNLENSINSGADALSKYEKYLPSILKERIINEDTLSQAGQYSITIISDLMSSFFYFLLSSLIIVPLTFFFYHKRGHSFKKKVADLIPIKYKNGFTRAWKDINKGLYDFFSVRLLQSFIISIICWIGFLIIDLEGWFFLGVLCGILNLIPYIGPWFSAIPVALVGFLENPTTALLGIIVIIVAQAVDNFYIWPFMIPGKISIDPLIGVILTYIGASLYGPLGMIFAMPIYIIYKVTLKELYEELRQIYPEKEERIKNI